MKFEALGLADVMRVALEPKPDERGFFARTFCAREFSAQRLPSVPVQCSISYNARRGTVRGLHFQWPPSQEAKLVRCVRGELQEVLVDLRPDSPTYLKTETVVLSDVNRDSVYVPPGVAHGFQTLRDHTEVLYQMSDYFDPELQGEVRWNDARFGIHWPINDIVISQRDAQCAPFDQTAYEGEYARRRGSLPRPSGPA